MITSIKKRILGARFRSKLIFVGTFSAFLVGFISYICLFRFNNACSSILYKQTAASLSSFSVELQAELNKIDEISFLVFSDTNVQKYLKEINSKIYSPFQSQYAKEQIEKQLDYYYNLNPYILSIVIMGNRDQYSCSWGFERSKYLTSSKQHMEEYSGIIRSRLGKSVWVCPPDNSVLCCRPIGEIESLGSNELGILLININLEKMINDIQHGQAQYINQYSVITDHDNMIYSSSDDCDLSVARVPSDNAYHIESVNNERMFLVSMQLGQPNWAVIYGVPYDTVFYSFVSSRTIVTLTIFFSILLAVGLASLLVVNTTRNFNNFVSKITHYAEGSFEQSPKTHISGNDEIGLLNCCFDAMTEKLNQLIKDNYDSKLLYMQEQLKELEQQINPHFLYNTLESINWQAKRNKENEICMMAESLGKLLRMSIGEKRKLVPLSFEYEVSYWYIQIQKLRYRERLIVISRIDQSLLNCLVPKMVLQPLLENAIQYSVEENREPCTITITANRNNEYLDLMVENTGSSIPHDILQQLADGRYKVNGTGVGLTNIDKRIKLIYGNSFGLLFDDTEENVARVRLIIPINEQEVKNDKTIDCR